MTIKCLLFSQFLKTKRKSVENMEGGLQESVTQTEQTALTGKRISFSYLRNAY